MAEQILSESDIYNKPREGETLQQVSGFWGPGYYSFQSKKGKDLPNVTWGFAARKILEKFPDIKSRRENLERIKRTYFHKITDEPLEKAWLSDQLSDLYLTLQGRTLDVRGTDQTTGDIDVDRPWYDTAHFVHWSMHEVGKLKRYTKDVGTRGSEDGFIRAGDEYFLRLPNSKSSGIMVQYSAEPTSSAHKPRSVENVVGSVRIDGNDPPLLIKFIAQTLEEEFRRSGTRLLKHVPVEKVKA